MKCFGRTIVAGVVVALAFGVPVTQAAEPSLQEMREQLSFAQRSNGFQSVIREIESKGRHDKPSVVTEAFLIAAKKVSVEQVFLDIAAEIRSTSVDDMDFFVRSIQFFRSAAFHGKTVVRRYDGVWNLNPITNLLVENLQCGEVNRLVVDYFTYAGFDARLVILTNHQAAEVMVDGRWRYADADMLDFNQFPRDDAGEIVGIREMYEDPGIMDRLIPYAEAAWRRIALNEKLGAQQYPGYVVRPNAAAIEKASSGEAERPAPPYFIEKKLQREEWQAAVDHGWRPVRSVDYDWKAQLLEPREIHYRPAPPWISRILKQKDGSYRLDWNSSYDPDKDTLGYRVHVSHLSRGWNYQTWFGRETMNPFWSDVNTDISWQGYRQIGFDFELDGFTTHEVKGNDITLPVDDYCGQTIFVSVTPFDAYGESIGNRTYMPSSEMTLTFDACT